MFQCCFVGVSGCCAVSLSCGLLFQNNCACVGNEGGAVRPMSLYIHCPNNICTNTPMAQAYTCLHLHLPCVLMSGSKPGSRSRSPTGLPNTRRLFDAMFSPEKSQPELVPSAQRPASSVHRQHDDELLSLLGEEFDSQDTQREKRHGAVYGLGSSTCRSLLSEHGWHSAMPEPVPESDAAVLEEAWATAKVDCQGLPIEFSDNGSASCDEEAEVACSAVISDLGLTSFYIGATGSVKQRWTGRHDMAGHCQKWRHMAVLAVRGGAAGGELETRCIRMVKGLSTGCANKVADARHLAHGINFVYLVWQ